MDSASVHSSAEEEEVGAEDSNLLWLLSSFQFVEDPGPGALLFLYSAVLSRGTTK